VSRERRNFARLELHAKAYMHWDDRYIVGELENVSIKGAFVTAPNPIGINNLVAFTIDNTSTCDRQAKVVRVTDKGIGLQFEKHLLD